MKLETKNRWQTLHGLRDHKSSAYTSNSEEKELHTNFKIINSPLYTNIITEVKTAVESLYYVFLRRDSK
ncbi:hypothetical protein KIN20_007566 [Parelaphostrongylus tenuis]|uniref:Uncharacterized protein n=1 Tax=Parelaphostrongylus tenuis TaxID=148309 RepID=A0AAD5M6R9_PARTN|nr:hypothetical protein KIN20_007566 [Parelaphostrongylus tenuis]